jgi:hypothetical protein
MGKEELIDLFNKITSNGMREMTVNRFIQAVNELPYNEQKENYCDNCDNKRFNETMGCLNYLQEFKCKNYIAKLR